MTISEEFLDENYSGFIISLIQFIHRNPAGFIHPHGMLHGLLTVDGIDRGSMVVTSKVDFYSIILTRYILINEVVKLIVLKPFRRWLICQYLKWAWRS